MKISTLKYVWGLTTFVMALLALKFPTFGEIATVIFIFLVAGTNRLLEISSWRFGCYMAVTASASAFAASYGAALTTGEIVLFTGIAGGAAFCFARFSVESGESLSSRDRGPADKPPSGGGDFGGGGASDRW